MYEFQVAYVAGGKTYFFTILANTSQEAVELLTPSGMVIVDVLPLSPELQVELLPYESDWEDEWEDDYDYVSDDLNFDAWRDTQFR